LEWPLRLVNRLEVCALDEACSNAAKEIVAVGFGLGQDFWLVAVFERYFLKEKFDGILGFKTLCDQLADARGEAIGVIGRAAMRESWSAHL
jgi:hypothetical protein